jgi:hypothetical protein
MPMICSSEYRFRFTVLSFSPGDSSVKWLDFFSSGHDDLEQAAAFGGAERGYAKVIEPKT